MKMETTIWFVAALSVSVSLGGCGGGSSSSNTGSGDGAQITSISSLPRATSPVSDGASANIAAALGLGLKLGASSTGMPLGSITASDFDSTMSLAACEMFNMTRQAIAEAAQGDLIQCYVTSTFEAAVATDTSTNIYDGSYHTFDLVFPADAEDRGPDKVKFKIVKTGDVITDFELFACSDGVQKDYLRQTISGGDFSMSSVNTGSRSGGNWSNRATVAGKLSSSGEFVDSVGDTATPKVIHMQHSGNDDLGTYDYWGDLTFNQSHDGAILSGTMGGGNTYNSQSCTFTNVIAGSVGLNDGNTADADPYQIGLLELADGAVKGQMAGACGGDDWSEGFTQAWSGATALALDDPASSAYYGDISGVTLAAGSEPAISFESAQTWDCSGTSERTVDFAALAASSGTNPMTSCSNLELDRDYIDCWHIMNRCSATDGFSDPDTLSCFTLYEFSDDGAGIVETTMPGSFLDGLTVSGGALTMDFNTVQSATVSEGGQGVPILAKAFESGDFEVELVIQSGLTANYNEVIGLVVGNSEVDDALKIIYGGAGQGIMQQSTVNLTTTSSSPVAYTQSGITFKISRAGNTYTSSYKAPGGDYVVFGTTTRSAAGDSLASDSEVLYIGIAGVTYNTNGTFAPVIDAFNVLSGDVVQQD